MLEIEVVGFQVTTCAGGAVLAAGEGVVLVAAVLGVLLDGVGDEVEGDGVFEALAVALAEALADCLAAGVGVGVGVGVAIGGLASA